MNNMNMGEILKAVNGILAAPGGIRPEEQVITGITTDSRNIHTGDLFIPIQGETFDGHDFIIPALEKGAVCALSHKREGLPNDKLIYVDDTRKALRDLAEYYLSTFNIPVVGITGSVGKTTTKDMVASVLQQKYNVLKSAGNHNNEIGLPLTVFQLDDSKGAIVLEMGMNHFGEIHNLSKIARPDIGIITNIGVSHIENLGSREGILKAKSELFDFIKEDGYAVLNGDDDMLETLKGSLACNEVFAGVQNQGDFYADHIENFGLDGIGCMLHTPKGDVYVHISVPGRHMILNALLSAAAGSLLGLSLEEIKTGIESFVPTKMRMSVLKAPNGITIIDDAYNANPVSTKAAIDVLAGIAGKTTAILGDMFELGEYAAKMHYEVGEYAAKKKIGCIICIGDAAQEICRGALDCGHSNVFYYLTQEEFFQEGLSLVEGAVLVKASRGMRFEETVEKLRNSQQDQ